MSDSRQVFSLKPSADTENLTDMCIIRYGVLFIHYVTGIVNKHDPWNAYNSVCLCRTLVRVQKYRVVQTPFSHEALGHGWPVMDVYRLNCKAL